MQILRHSQIGMTMEVYSVVPTAKPGALSIGSAGNLMTRGCCTFVLYGDRKGRFGVETSP